MASIRRFTRRQGVLALASMLVAGLVAVAAVPHTTLAPMLDASGQDAPGLLREGAGGPGLGVEAGVEAGVEPAVDARGLLPPTGPTEAAAADALPLPFGRPMPEPWAEAPRIARALAVPDLSARAAVVVDEASGQVLLGFDEHARLAPASLTKMATAILAVEHGDLDEEFESHIDGRDMVNSSLMGLRRGDRFTLRDLLYGLMLPSGNDAALVIAHGISGSEERFVEEMNDLARRLGLTNTHFENPHGLYQPGHYSSAYDLALLARYYMSLDPLPEIAATRSWTAEGSRAIEMKTLNPLLSAYEGADGVKTGYTKKSGPTFVASASRDGNRLYAVVLNDRKRAMNTRNLLDWAFKSYRWSDHNPYAAPVRVTPVATTDRVLRGAG